MEQRRTKIVATVGPACERDGVLEGLIEAGVDVFRLNFSHGTHETHAESIRRIRELTAGVERPVAVMQDLQGPRIRTGRLAEGEVELVAGDELVIAPGDFEGRPGRIATTYEGLASDLAPGNAVLVADGRIELDVLAIEGDEVRCRVVVGDTLGEHKGMNLPGVDVSIFAPTEKDIEDIAFGAAQGVDLIALSFVRSADDVLRVKTELKNLGGAAAHTPVIAKIERPEAVEHVESILVQADGLMVARGDLGIEMPAEAVPPAQKRLIRAANEFCVPVITATQMLESMIEHRRPTRAEACDVANAILDGTDAVMLSGETAIGRYPVRTVETMVNIAREIEPLLDEHPLHRQRRTLGAGDARLLALAEAACLTGDRLDAAGLVAFTHTGSTARFLSAQRPSRPVYALTPDEATLRRLALLWGVRGVTVPLYASTDEMIESGEERLLAMGLALVDDTFVCVAGPATPTSGGADMLKIHHFDGKNPYAG